MKITKIVSAREYRNTIETNVTAITPLTNGLFRGCAVALISSSLIFQPHLRALETRPPNQSGGAAFVQKFAGISKWSDFYSRISFFMTENDLNYLKNQTRGDRFPFLEVKGNEITLKDTPSHSVRLTFGEGGTLRINGKAWTYRPLVPMELQLPEFIRLAGAPTVGLQIPSLFNLLIPQAEARSARAFYYVAYALGWAAMTAYCKLTPQRAGRRHMPFGACFGIGAVWPLTAAIVIGDAAELKDGGFLPVSARCPRTNDGQFEVIARDKSGNFQKIVESSSGKLDILTSTAGGPYAHTELLEKSDLNKVREYVDSVKPHGCEGSAAEQEEFFKQLSTNASSFAMIEENGPEKTSAR